MVSGLLLNGLLTHSLWWLPISTWHSTIKRTNYCEPKGLNTESEFVGHIRETLWRVLLLSCRLISNLYWPASVLFNFLEMIKRGEKINKKQIKEKMKRKITPEDQIKEILQPVLHVSRTNDCWGSLCNNQSNRITTGVRNEFHPNQLRLLQVLKMEPVIVIMQCDLI